MGSHDFAAGAAGAGAGAGAAGAGAGAGTAGICICGICGMAGKVGIAGNPGIGAGAGGCGTGAGAAGAAAGPPWISRSRKDDAFMILVNSPGPEDGAGAAMGVGAVGRGIENAVVAPSGADEAPGAA
jgi:hypothetical protein